MPYKILAVDYDGTLATEGVVDEVTIDALTRLRASGRDLLMVTGRELPSLRATFGRLDLFTRIVAENGALIVDPSTGSERPLAEAPSPTFIDELRARGVSRISVGRVIVATWEPHHHAVLEAIRRVGLELEVIFNKGAVMVLPSGINKATGLKQTLAELGVREDEVVGIGDAENDHSFLNVCGLSVAVANALPALKERADLVTQGARGVGVAEVIERLLNDDLAGVTPRRGATSRQFRN
jgi:hydroxymethylpyrimidine pyrophosphatase-like HAD family hydrolase